MTYLTPSRDALDNELRKHRAGGYIAIADGHRECYCGHVLAADESFETHLSDALIAAGAVIDAATLADLHVEVPTFEHTDYCTDEEAHEWDSASDGEPICRTCPRHESVCGSCRDDDGDPLPWPCPTARALAAALTEREATR